MIRSAFPRSLTDASNGFFPMSATAVVFVSLFLVTSHFFPSVDALPPRIVFSAEPSDLRRSGSDSAPWPLLMNQTIVGSTFLHPLEVQSVRGSLECFARRGRWVYHPEPRPLPWNTQGLDYCDARWVHKRRDRIAGRKADRVTDEASWTVRKGLKYKWDVDPSCGDWQEFNKLTFCQAINKLGGPIMFAGDSMTRNMFESLNNLFQIGQEEFRNFSFTPRICRHWEKHSMINPSRRLCEAMRVCRYTIYRVRNDRLTRLEGRPHTQDNEYFLPWLSLIKTWGVKAVILNRGAHITPTNVFEQELDTSLWVLREKHPKVLIFYRSTPPGHLGCESYHTPLREPQERTSLPYGWGKFHEQNVIAKRLVEKYGGVYLHVDVLTSLRADGHRGTVRRKHDCLHYCNPGPVDSWVQMLHNALLQVL